MVVAPAKQSELGYLPPTWVVPGDRSDRIVESQHEVRIRQMRGEILDQGLLLEATAAPLSARGSSQVDQHAAHGHGRNRQEMGAVLPPGTLTTHNAQEHVMHECRQLLLRIVRAVGSDLAAPGPERLLHGREHQRFRLPVAALHGTKPRGEFIATGGSAHRGQDNSRR